MRFRNIQTGAVISVTNEDCLAIMQASPVYEEIVEAPAQEEPKAMEAPKASKPKASKAKASKAKASD